MYAMQVCTMGIAQVSRLPNGGQPGRFTKYLVKMLPWVERHTQCKAPYT